MENTTPFNWQLSLSQTYEGAVTQIIAWAPQLIGALALLLVGWGLAYALRILTKKLIKSFDSIFLRGVQVEVPHDGKLKRSYAEVVGSVVYWTVITFFIAATANMLGWDMFSSWMSGVISYLPNLVTGLLIILAGFVLGTVTKAGVLGAAHTAGLEQGEMLARIAQIVVVFTTLVIGVEQIGINVDFLTNVLILLVGVLAGGGALAFGLGAKTLIENIIGAQFIRKHVRIGELMSIGEFSGSIVEITQTSIVLDGKLGRIVVPAKQFQESVSQFGSGKKRKKPNKDKEIKTA